MFVGRELEKIVGSLQELGPAFSYNSSEADLVGDFYVPCLEVADSYDRAVGYFRSSVYQLVGVALSGFALNGGHMRLVCSPGLTSEVRIFINLDTQLHERGHPGAKRRRNPLCDQQLSSLTSEISVSQ